MNVENPRRYDELPWHLKQVKSFCLCCSCFTQIGDREALIEFLTDIDSVHHMVQYQHTKLEMAVRKIRASSD